MKINRKPAYSEDGLRRVVSVPGGLWQLQEHGNFKGTREIDPWFKRGEPADFDTAISARGA